MTKVRKVFPVQFAIGYHMKRVGIAFYQSDCAGGGTVHYPKGLQSGVHASKGSRSSAGLTKSHHASL